MSVSACWACVVTVCVTVHLYVDRSAIAKMETIQIAAKYLKEKPKWPILKGHKICMKPDTRIKHKKISPGNIPKIHNETMKECNAMERLNYIEEKDD